jgi:tRNA(Ile)-lysidine synthase
VQVIHPFLEKHNIEDTVFAIGVSGGADSLALALMFKQEYPNYKIIALTVDHQLRPTSRQEADYVASVMQHFGIEHHVLTWKGKKPETGIEERARIARYHLLCNWCKENNVKHLAIAHHLYDQAETFLMRLHRGSGIIGLSAMEEITTKDGILLMRPLLHTSPQVMKDFLTHLGLTWVEDESNDCDDYLRVRIRKFLPLLEKKIGISAEKLVLAADNIRQTKIFLEKTTQNLINTFFHQWGKLVYSVDDAVFENWHKELRFHILRHLIVRISEDDYPPEADSVLGLIENLEQKDFTSASLGDVLFIKSDLRLWLIKEDREKNLFAANDIRHFEDIFPEGKNMKIPAKVKLVLLKEKYYKK